MGRIKGVAILLIAASLFAFVVAWKTEIFAILGLAISLLLVSFAVLYPRYRDFLLLFISIFLTISFVEFSLLISEKYSLETFHDPSSGYSSGYSERVEGFGYRPVPGVHTSRKLHTSGEVIYDVTYTIGDDGYRQDLSDRPFSAYVFGGSHAFGEGLNDDETLSAFLLNDHGLNTKNVGVHGYGLHQALYNIERGISAVDGTNILLTAPWHALRSSCKPGWTVGTPRYVIEGDLAVLRGVCPVGSFLHRLLQRSQTYSLIRRALFNTENVITDEDINLYLAIINSIFQETNRYKSKLVIAYMDAPEEQMATTSWTNQTLITRLNEMSDQVIDVTLFDKIEQLGPQFYIHELDTHPNAANNKAKAQLIAEFFR